METRSIDHELCPNVPGKHKEHKVSQQPTAYHPYVQRTLTSEALSIDRDAKPNMRTRYISHAIQPPRSNSYHPIHCTNFSTTRESAHFFTACHPKPLRYESDSTPLLADKHDNSTPGRRITLESNKVCLVASNRKHLNGFCATELCPKVLWSKDCATEGSSTGIAILA